MAVKVEMSTEDLIRALKARRAEMVKDIDADIAYLESLQRKYGNGKVPEAANPLEPTNEEAVGAIFEDAYPEYLGIWDIVDRGPRIGGRELNKNSVRWVITTWAQDDKLEKKKRGNRAWYRLKRE